MNKQESAHTSSRDFIVFYRCWWVMETGTWVPAFAGMTEGWEWPREQAGVGAHVEQEFHRFLPVLVGHGDGDLGPRFRGDDGGVGKAT